MIKNKAAEVLLTTCSLCKRDEKILIVTDPASIKVSRILWDSMGDYPKKTVAFMEERKMHGQEPTEIVAAAMMDADVIFCCTKFSLFHSKARKNAVANGARFINMVDYSEEMMYTGGLFADFEKAWENCRKIAVAEDGAKELRIVCDNGSSFVCSVEGRKPFPQFARSINKGESSSPPDVECATCAVEGSGNGTVIIDGSIPHPDLGLIHDEIKLTINQGRIVRIDGGRQAKTLERLFESFHDNRVYNVGEIGIGLNPMCKLTGRMLEDEGCGGTAHFGCGDNTGFGGTVSCPVHIDLIFRKPTIMIDGRTILDHGEVVI